MIREIGESNRPVTKVVKSDPVICESQRQIVEEKVRKPAKISLIR